MRESIGLLFVLVAVTGSSGGGQDKAITPDLNKIVGGKAGTFITPRPNPSKSMANAQFD